MATVFENSREFKVLALSSDECEKWPRAEVCDNCDVKVATTGFYIPAVNAFFCTQCYEEWCQRAIVPHDPLQEEKCFDRARMYLEISE